MLSFLLEHLYLCAKFAGMADADEMFDEVKRKNEFLRYGKSLDQQPGLSEVPP